MSDASSGVSIGVDLGFSYTTTEDSIYRGYTLTARGNPLSWVLLSLSCSVRAITGSETFHDEILVLGVPTPRTTRFSYSTQGLGDLSLSAYANVAEPFLKLVDLNFDPPPAKGADLPTFTPFGNPMLFVGLGLKLPTGEHDAWDEENYNFDRTKSTTGEYSKADGVIPPYYQLGTGTTDLLLGATLIQRIWRFICSAGFNITFTGWENSVGYERADKLSWSLGTQFILYRSGPGLSLSARTGFSGLAGWGPDWDHSEDTTILGSQELGRISGSGRNYLFWDLGAKVSFLTHFSAALSLRFPISGVTNDSESSFKNQIAFSLGFKL